MGPTILETSFLLAGEPVLAYKEGKQFALEPVSERRVVDFGPGIGNKGLFLYNLPEVKSSHAVCMLLLLQKASNTIDLGYVAIIDIAYIRSNPCGTTEW